LRHADVDEAFVVRERPRLDELLPGLAAQPLEPFFGEAFDVDRADAAEFVEEDAGELLPLCRGDLAEQ
jgi:hypothetical protein